MSNCFCAILAVNSFGPGQCKGIAEKSIFQAINLNILKLEGKKGELRGSQTLGLDLI